MEEIQGSFEAVDGVCEAVGASVVLFPGSGGASDDRWMSPCALSDAEIWKKRRVYSGVVWFPFSASSRRWLRGECFQQSKCAQGALDGKRLWGNPC